MNKKIRFLELIGFIVIILGILSIIALTYSPVLDEKALLFAKETQNNFFNYSMRFITFIGSIEFIIALVIIALVLVYIYKKPALKTAWLYAIGIWLTALISYIIKLSVKRERPLNLLENDFSFPSIHSSISMIAYIILASFLWKGNRKLSYLFLIAPFLIGFSRIYLMVHWFSDVIAGLFLGALIAFFVLWFSHKN